MPRTIIVVRCPRCGSTAAEEDGGVYEFTEMACPACGHRQLCDEYQIKDTWNVLYEVPDGATALPATLPPDLPHPSASSRSPPSSRS